MATQKQIEEWIKIRTPDLNHSADPILMAVATDPSCIRIKDMYGNTPLLKLMRQGIAHNEHIHFSLENGADINAVDEDGQSAIWFTSGHLKWLEYLLQNNADPNIRDKEGCTFLMKMCEAGDTDFVQLLLDYGADPSIMNNKGQTAKDIVNKILTYKFSDKKQIELSQDQSFFHTEEINYFDTKKKKYENVDKILTKVCQIHSPEKAGIFEQITTMEIWEDQDWTADYNDQKEKTQENYPAIGSHLMGAEQQKIMSSPSGQTVQTILQERTVAHQKI